MRPVKRAVSGRAMNLLEHWKKKNPNLSNIIVIIVPALFYSHICLIELTVLIVFDSYKDKIL